MKISLPGGQSGSQTHLQLRNCKRKRRSICIVRNIKKNKNARYVGTFLFIPEPFSIGCSFSPVFEIKNMGAVGPGGSWRSRKAAFDLKPNLNFMQMRAKFSESSPCPVQIRITNRFYSERFSVSKLPIVCPQQYEYVCIVARRRIVARQYAKNTIDNFSANFPMPDFARSTRN